MKLKLIAPRNPVEHFWSTRKMRDVLGRPSTAPNLALLTVAALTPSYVDVSLEDEALAPIDFSEPVDLVGLTAMTSFAPRAFEIAMEYKSRHPQVKVVMGGIHASVNPEECSQHVDGVVIGEAELVWDQVIRDVRDGTLQPRYRATDWADITQSPVPRWDLIDPDKYTTHVVQTTRGCPHDCDFCSIKAYLGPRYRHKTVDQVLHELDQNRTNAMVFFADDNFAGNRKFVKELLRELRARPVSWGAQATADVAGDPELLDMMKEAGCVFLFIGFESLSEENLADMNKRVGRPSEYADAIRRIHNRGIMVIGSFIIGGDHDKRDCFETLARFCEEAGLTYAMVNLLTAPLNTRLRERMIAQNRLIETEYSLAGTHVSILPKQMTVEELQNGYYWTYHQLYSYPNMAKRVSKMLGEGDWTHPQLKPDRSRLPVLSRLIRCYLVTTSPRQLAFFLRVFVHVFRRNVDLASLFFVLLWCMNYADFEKQLPRNGSQLNRKDAKAQRKRKNLTEERKQYA